MEQSYSSYYDIHKLASQEFHYPWALELNEWLNKLNYINDYFRWITELIKDPKKDDRLEDDDICTYFVSEIDSNFFKNPQISTYYAGTSTKYASV